MLLIQMTWTCKPPLSGKLLCAGTGTHIKSCVVGPEHKPCVLSLRLVPIFAVQAMLGSHQIEVKQSLGYAAAAAVSA